MDFTDGIWFALVAVGLTYWMVRRYMRYGFLPHEGWKGHGAAWW